jgi:hypothetical protein
MTTQACKQREHSRNGDESFVPPVKLDSGPLDFFWLQVLQVSCACSYCRCFETNSVPFQERGIMDLPPKAHNRLTDKMHSIVDDRALVSERQSDGVTKYNFASMPRKPFIFFVFLEAEGRRIVHFAHERL